MRIQDPLDFFKKYKLLNSSDNFSSLSEKSKVCRFCGKNDIETTFKQKTHLIPELLGRNNIQTHDECDLCNNLFSGYESNLATFVRPYITLLGIKGKRTVPVFQSRSIQRREETRTILKHKKDNRKELLIQDIDDYYINKETKTFDITFRKSAFTPIYIYKALMKIGLSLLPGKFDKYNKTSFEWLTNRSEQISFFPYGFATTLKRSYFAKPSAFLYRAVKLYDNNVEFPEHTLIMLFANQVFQVFLPFSEELLSIHDEKRNMDIIIFPSIAYENMNIIKTVEIRPLDFSINHSITQDQKISFSYQDAKFNSFSDNQ